MQAVRRAERRMRLTSPPWEKSRSTSSRFSGPWTASLCILLVVLLISCDHAAKRRVLRNAAAPKAIRADFDRADKRQKMPQRAAAGFVEIAHVQRLLITEVMCETLNIRGQGRFR